METSNRKEFDEKLIIAFKKITSSNSRILDEIYLEKLLTHIKSQIDNECESYVNFSTLTDWLYSTIQIWKENPPNVHIAVFFCQFVELLTKNEEGFKSVQNLNILNELVDVLGQHLLKNTSLVVVLTKLFSTFLNHKSGLNWVIDSQHWKIVVRIYFSNPNLYVEREGLILIKKLISKVEMNHNVITEIFQEILLPISKNELPSIENKKILFSKMCLSFKLIEAILKEYLFVNNSKIYQKLKEIIDLELFLKSLLKDCEDENLLDAAATLYVTFMVVQFEDKKELVSEESNSLILEVFYILLEKNHCEGIIKLAKFCQILCHEVKKNLNCESGLGVHFIILQLVPALIYNKKPPNTKLFDLFIQKLFALTSNRTIKLAYSLKYLIRDNKDSKQRDWALKGVLSAMGHTDTLNNDEAVLIFQTMAYLARAFVPKNKWEEDFHCEIPEDKEQMICVEDASLLLATLNSLCLLIQKFKINWTESLESLCVLKMTCAFLENLELPSVVIVKTLLLVKLAILNFMSPNLALLLNHSEDSSFENLIPILYKRMHDPSWEIRDSCIEVIGTIAELAESKYPAFQQLLIEKDFCLLVFNIMEGDSESYVRATALKALSAMMKVEILNKCLMKLDFPSKIIKLLQTESEGIVRREAALIVKQIYLGLNESDEILNSFYLVMGYSAICDLHWEVKVNSLFFWEAVIHRVISDQGMIDGAFPKVTFSKENKKIVTLTNAEIKLRLDKVLNELSKIGCLYVLLSTLNDDCDLPVIEKSAQILTDLINILKSYNVIMPNKNLSACERIKLKRKNQNSSNSKKRRPSNLSDDESAVNEAPQDFDQQAANSDAIIEEIVNEMDINLLVSVYNPKKENTIIQKKILLKEIKPEAFLSQMQDFNSEIFLKEKQKWFTNIEVDLSSILNDIINSDSKNETNLLDCY